MGRPLWWALEQVGLVGEEGLLSSGNRKYHHKDTSWWGEYVFVSLVEKAAEAVIERQELTSTSRGDSLFTFESFRTRFAGVAGGEENQALRETDAKVVIKYLERERGVVVIEKEVHSFCRIYASFLMRHGFRSSNSSTSLKNRRSQPLTAESLSLRVQYTIFKFKWKRFRAKLKSKSIPFRVNVNFPLNPVPGARARPLLPFNRGVNRQL